MSKSGCKKCRKNTPESRIEWFIQTQAYLCHAPSPVLPMYFETTEHFGQLVQFVW